MKASNKICPDKMSEDFGSLLESGQFRYYRTFLFVIRILILSSSVVNPDLVWSVKLDSEKPDYCIRKKINNIFFNI